jgi:hypothetical protein
MALVLKDRVKETSTTAGTGTITLAGAVAGFQSFAAVGNGNSTYYAIVDPATGAWEVGIGTYTSSGTTLSRTTVLSSSNSGSLVSFAANSKDVFVTYPSERAVWLDSAGNVLVQYEFNTINATTANITTANLTSGTISTTPTNNTDIVNKQYADAIASGIHFHEAVDLATTAALPANTYNNGTSGVGATLTANANGALSVDSTLTVVSNRILVKNQVTQANNGVYTVTQVGSAGTPYILTRATDFDTAGTGVDQIDEGDFFLVTSGVVNLNTAWVQQTAPPITIGTTAIVFQQFAAPITYTAGTGLSESPTYTFNIANTGTAGTYGSASAVPVFVTNAQGQVTSVTNTNIAINGSAVTGNISGSAGSVANALTLGTYLTGTSYNGSAAVTATVDATSANTASKVVARDASGNFSAGTITAALSGNATTATTATNVAGGTANQIVYNTSAGTTNFAAAPSASGQLLGWNGSAYAWVSPVPTTSGGTGLTSFTSGGVVYASSTSALATGSALTFDGSFYLGLTGAMKINSNGYKLRFYDSTGSTGYGYLYTDGTNFQFDSGNSQPLSFLINGTEKMRLTSTGLGIGTSSPSNKLEVVSSSGTVASFRNSGAAVGQAIVGNTAGDLTLRVTASGDSLIYSDTSKYLAFGSNGSTERMRLDSAGNLGLGVTPSAWVGRALQIGLYSGYGIDGNGNAFMANNAYNDTSSSYRYVASSLGAGQYRQGFGTHAWFNAPSGTAGDAITFTQAMTLNASGNLGVGTTSPAVRLDVQSSTANIFATSTTGTNGVSIRAINTGGYMIVGRDTSTGSNYGSAYASVLWSSGAYPMLFATNDTERFRIGTSGQLGIGGANYGTSGQVLTSNGSGAAPSWQTSAAAAKGFAVGMSLVFGR